MMIILSTLLGERSASFLDAFCVFYKRYPDLGAWLVFSVVFFVAASIYCIYGIYQNRNL